MDQQQNLRLLAIDGAGRCSPLAFGLPHGQAIGKSLGDLVAQE